MNGMNMGIWKRAGIVGAACGFLLSAGLPCLAAPAGSINRAGVAEMLGTPGGEVPGNAPEIGGARPVGDPMLGVRNPLTGRRARGGRDWLGLRMLPKDTPILLMPGHADSQNMPGSGTSGEAVGLKGASPMDPAITDELFWNLKVAAAVARLGRERGLDVSYYDPVAPDRKILDENDARTTWSVGKEHVRKGGYALEIHFDAYGPDGYGSGVIVPLHDSPTTLDSCLAWSFGGFPGKFRGGLGGPKRGLALLEIGKLEGRLERELRDPATREAVIDTVAGWVVDAFVCGLGGENGAH